MRSTLLSIPLMFVVTVVANAQSSWLGLSVNDGSDSGVRVVEVEAGSPGADAGLEAGDLILEFDGMRVVGARQFTRVVRETPVGRLVTVRILRGSNEHTLRLTTRAQSGFRGFPDFVPGTLGDLAGRVRRAFPDIQISMSVSNMGIQIDGMTSELREFFGVDPEIGVLVVSVEPESGASSAGVRVGDVIITVDGRDIASPSDFGRRAFRNRDSVALTLVRDRSELEVTLDLTPSDN